MVTCSICGSQSRRNTHAAKRFFRKLLKGLQYVPRVIITDKLKSYGAAKREILPGVEHRQHKGLNNRAENSHQPTRLREKKMRRFKSAKQAQRFLSAFGPITGHFQPRRHRLCKRRIPCHFTGQIPRVERGNRSKTHRITVNPPQYFTAFSISPLYISAIHCVPTNKLTIPFNRMHSDTWATRIVLDCP